MADSAIKARISDAMKEAMRAKDKERLATIRLMMSAFKQIEVDERIELDDERVIAVLDKMIKQRRESIRQFDEAGRSELSAKEQAEIEVIQDYLPAALSEAEINAIIADAIRDCGASSMKDMGAVMNSARPQLTGRADMSQVSALVKKQLS